MIEMHPKDHQSCSHVIYIHMIYDTFLHYYYFDIASYRITFNAVFGWVAALMLVVDRGTAWTSPNI